MINEQLLKNEEKAVFILRSLYRRYGYLPFKMSKFEEYDFYLRNKDFLVSDRVITFNDTNGKMMALKPDVTLSIVKSGDDIPGYKQKVYYNENVYRVSDSTKRFKEIMQCGLECIGDVDLYDVYEVISLACESMFLISPSFVLDISHLGILSSVLNEANTDSEFQKKAMSYISSKNMHDLKTLCDQYEISDNCYNKICRLISLYGDRDTVINGLNEIVDMNEFEDLKTLSEMLKSSPFSSNIRFDFSIVNDFNYYNGFTFKGFINGIFNSVLAGGQYDNLMQKMNRKSKAVGFAIYLDLLETLDHNQNLYDVDMLIVYDDTIPIQIVANKVGEYIKIGLSVTAQKTVPEKLRYKDKIVLCKENV